MAISIYPITSRFVAEIGDVDLSQPLSSSEIDEIKQAFWDYAVLVFPGQNLTNKQHLAFAEYIGPLESNLFRVNPNAKFRLNQTPDLIDVSNLTLDNAIWGAESRMRQFNLGNRLWHTDSSFKYLPARASLLYAVEIPPVGGHTEFADLRAAYDALPEEMKQRLDGLVAEHSLAYSRAKTGFVNFTEAEQTTLPPVPQVIVRTIPENGRKSLYIASHAGRIRGMEEEAGRALLAELMAHATQRQFVHAHRWREHDLVMWDNCCTLHRGADYDDLRWRRELHRATVSDIANTCEQEKLAPVVAL